MASKIAQKAAKYKRISTLLYEGQAHLADKFTPPPQILYPPEEIGEKNDDDISDFPRQLTVPIPEAIPYPEGKYRPASIPVNAGFWPYNMYLQAGKVYWFCTCGISQDGPWCDSLCNHAPTRNRPMYFNVNENGYYKICNCKLSANAPFCNGTHKDVTKFYVKTHRGFYEFWGQAAYYLGWVYMCWNFYT